MYYNIEKSGAQIRQLRTKNGLTQEKLASTLNIDRSLLSHVEAGKRGCSVDLFVRLSDFFDVSLDLLILVKDRPAPLDTKDRAMLKTEIETLVGQLEAFKEKL